MIAALLAVILGVIEGLEAVRAGHVFIVNLGVLILGHGLIVAAKVTVVNTFCGRYSRDMSPRTGRPPVENPRSNIERFRTTDAEHAALAAAAERAGKALADWMRERLVAAAKRQH